MKQLNEHIKKIQNNSYLTEYFEKIPLKNKKTKKSFLESAVLLSYILYLIQDKNYLIIVTELSEVEFFSDYDYWTWIEYAICLLAYQYKEENKLEKFNQLKTKLDNTLNQGKNELVITVKKNIHQRFLSGEMLDKSAINEAINEKDSSVEIHQRLVFMMRLIKLKVYAEQSRIDKDKLNHEIANNSTIIRDYFNKNGLKMVFPFS